MCVHSVQFIFLCLIYPRFSDEAYFFSIRLIFVIFNVKYFCIEAKIEIKFASPLTLCLFKDMVFYDFQGGNHIVYVS